MQLNLSCSAIVATLLALLMMLGMAGCQGEPSQPTTPETPSNPSGQGTESDPVESETKRENENKKENASLPEVVVGDRARLDQIIVGHRGKIVLVDFWATWCAPCVQQFPHTVELANAHPDQLAVVAVSMDQPEDVELVREFLGKRKATFENLLSIYGIGQEGFEAFEITDGALPHYKIFDREGKLLHTASSSDKVDPLLEPLLRDPAAASDKQATH